MQRTHLFSRPALLPLGLGSACLLSLSSVSAAQSAPTAPLHRVNAHEPHLVVRLLPGQSPDALAASLGGTVLRSRPAQGIHLIDVPGASTSVAESLAWALKGLPTVLYSEVDQIVDPPESLTCEVPETSLAAMQCTVPFIDGAPAPGTYGMQAAVEQISASEATALATGIPMVVAVIDTGLDLSHPLFENRIAPGGYDYVLGLEGGADVGNGLDDDGDGAIDEAVGHGSHVAGLVALVDPAAMILPMRALDGDGYGSAFLVASAIYDAVDSGATTINLSLSTRLGCNVLAEALMYAEYRGVDVITSSGNSGDDVQFPGCFQPADYPSLDPTWLPAGTVLTGANLLTVAGVDIDDAKPVFACSGPEVDLVAPGVDVYSAHMGGEYAWWSGTSMSSGLAAGSVSYLKSIWSQGSHSGSAQELLQATTDNIDAKNPGLSGKLGTGRIDLEEAVKQLLGI